MHAARPDAQGWRDPLLLPSGQREQRLLLRYCYEEPQRSAEEEAYPELFRLQLEQRQQAARAACKQLVLRV